MKTRNYWCLLFVFITIIILMGCSGGSDDTLSDSEGKILLITDLHFDPISNPTVYPRLEAAPAEEWENIFRETPLDWGDYGKATTFWMFFSILNSLKNKSAEADAVAFLGDLLAHNFNQTYFELSGSQDQSKLQAFTRKTYQFVYLSMAKAMAGKRIIFTLGNNDYYCGNYQIQPHGSFLSDLSGLVSEHLMLNSEDQVAFDRTFREGGYYSMKFPVGSNNRLIVLNNVFFSNRYSNSCGSEPDTAPGEEELSWLQGQLEDARKYKQKAWLFLHIPPGLNIYGTIYDHMVDGQIDEVDDFWREGFGAEVQNLLAQYSDVLVGSFSGHTHQDDFRSISNIRVYNKIIPALSPVSNNNPGYILLSYSEKDLEASDYQVFYLDLAATRQLAFGQERWLPEYDYSSTYQVDGLNLNVLSHLHKIMYGDGETRTDYKTLYDVSNADNDPMNDEDKFQAYWCGQSEWAAEDFLDCFNNR